MARIIQNFFRRAKLFLGSQQISSTISGKSDEFSKAWKT